MTITEKHMPTYDMPTYDIRYRETDFCIQRPTKREFFNLIPDPFFGEYKFQIFEIKKNLQFFFKLYTKNACIIDMRYQLRFSPATRIEKTFLEFVYGFPVIDLEIDVAI